jgi:hypothetical protein
MIFLTVKDEENKKRGKKIQTKPVSCSGKRGALSGEVVEETL